MVSYTRTTLRIAEIVKLAKDRRLVLQPKFQRRSVWEENARSYLIDTVVRNLPMPKIFLRSSVVEKSGLAGYEVVDGQQRLRAILDFHEGGLILSKRFNTDFPDATFSTLPDPVQRAFLGYQLSAEVMEGASDPEVWAMFERLNTYTLSLNRQEKVNARFFGYFKQSAYRLAAEPAALEAWKSLRVFGDKQIARMKEVELTSDVMVALVDGISDITAIPGEYRKLDKEFPGRKRVEDTFRASLSYITLKLASVVRRTGFRKRTWFYTLMVAVTDASVGIPDGMGPATLQAPDVIRRRMIALDSALRPGVTPTPLIALADSFSKQTSHVPPRTLRHRYFFDMLTLPEDKWAKGPSGLPT